MRYDDLDNALYLAMFELGWIIPQTEHEVEIAERAMCKQGINPELPECLKEPPTHRLKGL